MDLYAEITESEKTRSDFLKWKLIGVAALGAAGLGLNQGGGAVHVYFLLVLIPPVCFYVDLLCRHISLRILIIAAFLRRYGSDEQRRFQEFVKEKARSEHLLHLEDTALEGSTVVLSFLIMVVGLTPRFLSEVTGEAPTPLFRLLAPAVGVLGVLAALVLNRWYAFQSKRLDANR